MIKKGRVKIKEIIEKIKTKIPDIIETIKTLPQMMGKIPAKLKSLLEKIKAIPSIVYKNVKGAVEFCEKSQLNSKVSWKRSRPYHPLFTKMSRGQSNFVKKDALKNASSAAQLQRSWCVI